MRRAHVGRAGRLPLLLLALVLAVPTRAQGHELAEASATLAIREGGHLEVRLQVPWAEVLHRRLMPTRSLTDFLARITSEPDAELHQALASIRSAIEAGTLIVSPDGRTRRLSRWSWPSPAQLRGALQEELMERMTGATDLTHPARLATTAELIEPGVGTVRLRFPVVLGPVLLTVVRPSQTWVPAGGTSTVISLGRTQRPGRG